MNREILWNIINSLLAGALVFMGSLTSGSVTRGGIIAAIITSSGVALSKFQEYWRREEMEYVDLRESSTIKMLFKFV